jgi:ABC-type nitrate/sulfonate/bicarbonate transport system substrate-binding protein
MFRAGHSQFWEVADKAGILARHRISLTFLEPTNDPRVAEEALFSGRIDLICGNHITPYKWVALGKPIVCLASPSNGVRNRVITREPVSSLAEFKAEGLRIADTNEVSQTGLAGHGRLNHVIDIWRQGYAEGEAQWIEVGPGDQEGPPSPELTAKLIEAVKSGRAHAAFVGRGDFEGLHVLDLPPLPMINGTTITTSYEALNQKQGLAERLVRAMVETIHYARMNPEEAQTFLNTKDTRPYTQHGGRIDSITRSPIKPYPSAEGVLNAYELARMRYEEARAANPFALWDMHYLRDLDLSGFIDELIQEEPEAVRAQYEREFQPVGGAHLFTQNASQ